MPRYSFLLTRFAGGSVRQGLRQGATPDSSCLILDSVTISYAVGICVFLLLVWISFRLNGSRYGFARGNYSSGVTSQLRNIRGGKRGNQNNLDIKNSLRF